LVLISSASCALYSLSLHDALPIWWSPTRILGTTTARSVQRTAREIDDLPGDVPGVLIGEEGDRVGDVLGNTHAAHGDVRLAEGLHVLVLDAHAFGGRAGHGGLDESGGHGVAGDSELAEFDGKGLGEALQACLGGGVVGLAPVALGGGAGEVDDAAPTFLGHVRLGGLAHQERTPEVDVHDGV